MTVWTKKGHGLLPKTNSEYSQMDFPLQSCVNERKQGSASQGLHCDTTDRSTFCSLIEGNLQEFGPHFSLPFSDGNPHLGYLENSRPASCYMRGCLIMLLDILYIWLKLPNLTFSWCQLHLMFFLFCSTNSWNILKIKTNAQCSHRSEVSEIYCWKQVNKKKKKKYLRVYFFGNV